MKEINYQLLDDQIIDFQNGENDLLGNQIYADLLSEVIEEESKNKEIETIALAGKWGIGKSSVIKTVQNSLSNRKLNNKKTDIRVYNAWKYSKDDFRKAFLIDLVDEKKKSSLEDELYKETTRSHFVFNKNVFTGIVIVGLIISIIILCFVGYKWGIKSVSDAINFILSFLGISLAVALIGIMRSLFSEDRVTTVKSFSTIDFANKFRNIVESSEKFFVFIVDDLDRCTPRQSIDILEIIQGYLKESKAYNYLFLIPIDQDRLAKHLEVERRYDKESVEQYFNKIFDLKIEMQNAGNTNLYNMLKEINKKYNYNFSSFSLSIMSDYLIKTPRDIVKHLNNINILRMLMSKRTIAENKDSFNDDELVKLYVIKNIWPCEYEELLSKYYQVTDLNQYLKVDIPSTCNDNMKKFIIETRTISISRIMEFEYLKYRDISNEKIIGLILGMKYDEIEKGINSSEEYNLKEIKDTIVYMHKIYIIERNLGKSYILPLLSAYLWLVNYSYEYGKELTNEVLLSGLLVEYKKHMTNLDENNSFSSGDYASLGNNLSANIDKYYEESFIKDNLFLMMNVFESTQNFELLSSILKEDSKLNLISNEKRTELIDFIISNDSFFDNKIEDVICKKDNEDIINNNVLDSIIQKSGRGTIISISKYNPQLLYEKIDDIIAEIELLNLINSDFYNYAEDEINELLGNIDYILELIPMLDKVFSLKIYNWLIEYKNNFIDMDRRLKSLNSEYNSDLLINKLTTLLLIASNDANNLEVLYAHIEVFKDSRNHFEELRTIPKSLITNEMKASIYIAMLSLLQFCEDICDDIFKECQVNQVLCNRLDFLVDIIREKDRCTIEIENIGTVYFDYTWLSSYFLNNCWRLPLDNFRKIIDSMNFDELIGNIDIMNNISTFNNYELYCSIIRRTSTFEQCELLYSYISKDEFRKEYHEITRNLIQMASSITLLHKIHDNEKTDKIELRWIKEKIDKDFENVDKEVFNHIIWE